MYTIYLSDNAKHEMQSKNIKEIESISERLQHLKHGRWKNGTRVKKLHGVNRAPIFEARVDGTNRMLFAPCFFEESNETALIIYHLSVEHDRVIRTAKALLGNKKGELFETEITNEIEKELVIAEQTWQSQYFEPYAGEKLYTIDEETLIRFMQKEDIAPNEFWELRLKLTHEQQEVLQKPLPLLISGTAGSGKTTIILHKLLTNPFAKKIYVTYNKELVEEAKKQFEQLVSGRDYELELNNNTTFLSFEELLKRYRKDEFAIFMTKEHFIFEYQKYAKRHGMLEEFPPLMVWEELRSIWKSSAYSDESVLSLDNYKSLTEQEAPNFYNKRDKAYKILEWYLAVQRKQDIEDELDVIYRMLNTEQLSTYDLVICDEVQDISMRHVQLLFQLSGNEASRLILTGDDQQVIQHSGFRWENIKNAFYKKLNVAVNEITQLSHNFRNSGKIAELAGAINDLQRNYTEFQYKTKRIDYFKTGKKPILYVSMPDKQIIKKMNHFGPYDAVLVRDEQTRQALIERCKKCIQAVPLIFTVAQAKGLEFQRILLWSMFKNDGLENKEWQKLARSLASDLSYRIQENPIVQRFIRYEVSLLYVAVTRGIQTCLIYDGETPGAFWKLEGIQEKIDELYIDVENNKDTIQSFTDEEWIIQGKRLIEKRLYEQALECFKRAQQHYEASMYKKLCQAHLEKEKGQYNEAARLYIDIEQFDEALICLEAVADYQTCYKICNRLLRCYKDDHVRHSYYENLYNSFKVKEFDQLQQWTGGAIYCRRMGKYLEAINRFEKANADLSSNSMLRHLYGELLYQPIFKTDIVLQRKAKDYYKRTSNSTQLMYIKQLIKEQNN